MDSRDQVVLAGRLNAALLAAGLEVARLKQRSGHTYYMTAAHLDVLRRFLRDVAWLLLVAVPVARALTALVLAWTSAAGDPIGLAR